VDDREHKKGIRNGWILTVLLLLLVAFWTAFTLWANQDEVSPAFDQGGRDFIPGSSVYGSGYETKKPENQE
jgi:hypothetical protein